MRILSNLMLCSFAVLLLNACSNSSIYGGEDQTPTRSVAPGSIGALSAAHGQALETGALNGITAAHNRWREPLGLPPLKWSEHLAAQAQVWADNLQQQGCRRLRHDPKAHYGENLAAGTHLTATGAVRLWTDEAAYYDARSNTCMTGQVCGHYTQVVWRDTQQLGCGVAYCQQFAVWVCRYNPPGNVIGRRPY